MRRITLAFKQKMYLIQFVKKHKPQNIIVDMTKCYLEIDYNELKKKAAIRTFYAEVIRP